MPRQLLVKLWSIRFHGILSAVSEVLDETYRQMDMCNKAKMPHFLTFLCTCEKRILKKKKARFQWVNIPDTLFVKVTVMWYMMPWVVQICTRETWCLSLQRRNSEDHNLCNHRCGELKYHIFWLGQYPLIISLPFA
jgi:hypothetical protein